MKKLITKVITFISFILIAMETFNRIVLYLAKKEIKVNPITDKTYNWRFGDIKYMVRGEGEPLLLVHDMTPGSSSLEWKNIINTLSKNYCVYALDLPGFGISDKQIKTYTNYLYTSAICDFISDVIKDKTTVITSNKAANIAVLSAYQHKNLFNKIIFVNPGSIEDYNKIPDKACRNFKNFISLPIIGTFVYLINLIKDKNLNNEQLFAAQYDGKNARYYYGSYIGNYVNFPIHHRIENVDVPLLLITGEEYDNIFGTFLEYSKYVDNSYSIKNASQFPHLEKPEAFCSALDILSKYDYNDK